MELTVRRMIAFGGPLWRGERFRAIGLRPWSGTVPLRWVAFSKYQRSIHGFSLPRCRKYL